jgi:hypothetical protein
MLFFIYEWTFSRRLTFSILATSFRPNYLNNLDYAPQAWFLYFKTPYLLLIFEEYDIATFRRISEASFGICVSLVCFILK